MFLLSHPNRKHEYRLNWIYYKPFEEFQEEFIFPGLNSSNGRPLRFDFAVFDDDNNIDFLIEYQGR